MPLLTSSSSVLHNYIGISHWQIYQWPDVFEVGWHPSSSSQSSATSNSSSSVSSSAYDSKYSASGFTATAANGCYHKTGTWENERPVYSNGSYYLKYGGEAYPKWFLQQISSFTIHYWSDITIDP